MTKENNIMNDAASAWAASKTTHARSAFIAGYEQGAFDERGRVATFITENLITITEFAGARATEMVAWMLREMTYEVVSS